MTKIDRNRLSRNPSAVHVLESNKHKITRWFAIKITKMIVQLLGIVTTITITIVILSRILTTTIIVAHRNHGFFKHGFKTRT